jgi:hypothetical protein
LNQLFEFPAELPGSEEVGSPRVRHLDCGLQYSGKDMRCKERRRAEPVSWYPPDIGAAMVEFLNKPVDPTYFCPQSFEKRCHVVAGQPS